MPGSRPWILGLSSGFHNGAACLLHGDTVVAAVQEERLTRRKRDAIRPQRPPLCVGYCLAAAGLGPGELDAVVDCTILPPGIDPDTGLQRWPLIDEAERSAESFVIPHHLGHAFSAFATSGFVDALALVVDGGGSFGWQLEGAERSACLRHADALCEHLSIYRCSPDGVQPVEKHLSLMPYLLKGPSGGMPDFASFGHMFSSVSWQIFGDYHAAGKTMALAALGRGDISPSQFFRWEGGEVEFSSTVPRNYGHQRRWPDERDNYVNLAASTQAALETGLRTVRSRLLELGTSRLCYAGGVALNGVANRKVLLDGSFQDVHIVPFADDGGVAVGAAYYGLWKLTGRLASRTLRTDFLGRPYENSRVQEAMRTVPGVSTVSASDPMDEAVDRLCEGQVVGWFCGGSEFGPRALGHRSILSDPRSPDSRRILNAKVKHRESFRPFAPVIMAEHIEKWFDVDAPSNAMRFMLDICSIKDPELRSQVPSALHVDGSARVQTVYAHDHPLLYELLRRFYSRTGVPMLLNTSLNVSGEPIVELPEDALWILLSTEMDACFVQGHMVVPDAAVSVADLVPVMSARLTRGQKGMLNAAVETHYGQSPVAVPDHWLSLLKRIDGKISLGELCDTAPSPEAATSLLDAVWLLRRYRLVQLHERPRR